MRTILHINIVNFYIAVAGIIDPKLHSYPVAVATPGTSRRTLLDVSQCAYEAGVFRGMLANAAIRRCPDLTVLNPSPIAYKRVSKAIMAKAAQLSPFVESAGPGHLFIDLTGTKRLFGRSIDVGDKFRKSLKESFNLENTVGIASNKLVSKVATRVIKPAGLCSVVQGSEEEFMAPLPIRMLPGVDSKVIRQLCEFNLHNIKEIHSISHDHLYSVLGSVAHDVYRFCRGKDEALVKRIQTPVPSIEEMHTLNEHTNDENVILKELLSIVIRAGMRLRKMGLAACKLSFTITYSNGSQNSKTIRLPKPINGDMSLFEQFARLLKELYQRRIRLSAISLLLSELSFPYGQMDLFDEVYKEDKLMGALDCIRDKFGVEAVKFCGTPGQRL